MTPFHPRDFVLVTALVVAPSLAAAAPACETFDGLWTANRDGSGGSIAAFYIDDACKVYQRDSMGYWSTFVIDGAFVTSQVYDNARYTQMVRGTWSAAKDALMIEVLDAVEDGFHPAFGHGTSRFDVSQWSIDPSDRDVLVIRHWATSADRDTFTAKTTETTERYYRQVERK
jgi:hypothetical protein